MPRLCFRVAFVFLLVQLIAGCDYVRSKFSQNITLTSIRSEESDVGRAIYVKSKDTFYLVTTSPFYEKIVLREIYQGGKSWDNLLELEKECRYLHSIFHNDEVVILNELRDTLFLDLFDVALKTNKKRVVLSNVQDLSDGPLWIDNSGKLCLALSNHKERILYVVSFSKDTNKIDTLAKLPISANLYYGQARDTLLFFEDKRDSSLVKWTPNTLTHFRQYRHIIPRFLSGDSLFVNDEDNQIIFKLNVHNGLSDTVIASTQGYINVMPLYYNDNKMVIEIRDKEKMYSRIGVRDSGVETIDFLRIFSDSFVYTHCEAIFEDKIYVYHHGIFYVYDL